MIFALDTEHCAPTTRCVRQISGVSSLGTAGASAPAFFKARFSASAHKVFRRASGGSSSICILFEKAHKLSSRNT